MNRSYKLLWLSRTVSIFGDWMLDITLPIWIYSLTGSVTLLSVVLAAATLPSVVLSPLVGALVDRWHRKTVLVVTNLLLALSTLTLLVVEDEQQTWVILLVAVVNGIVSAFLLPAQEAILPEVVSEEQRPRANSMMVLSVQSMRFAGPAVAGVIIATWGVKAAITVDVITFLIALLCCAALTIARHEATAKTNLLADAWSGLKIVTTHPSLNTLLAVWSIMMVAGGLITTTLVVFLQDVLGVSEAYYGYTLAVQGAGMFVGGILMMTILQKVNPTRTFTIGLVLFSLLLLTIANSNHIILTMVGVALMGVQMAVVVISDLTLIQQATQTEHRGRVMALNHTVMSVGMLVGIALAGGLVSMLDARTVINIAAALACLSTGIAVVRAAKLSVPGAPSEAAIP